ncbi:MAG: SDR family NAD(P)-dependent oxidoreductase [Bacteroidales bacterium]
MGKGVIITGANRGIGKEVAKQIAKLRQKVYMAYRSIDSAKLVRDEIVKETNNPHVYGKNFVLAPARLINNFENEYKQNEIKLDVLISNTGIGSHSKKFSEPGVEMTFAVNVLGHELITKLLLDELKNATPSRIINVASQYADELDWDDIHFERRRFNKNLAYKQSKQACRMLTHEWARRLVKDNITVYSVHPGFSLTQTFSENKLPWAK